MVTTIDVKNYINTDDYFDLLNKTISSLSISLRTGDIPSQVFNIDANNLNKAGINLDELRSIKNDDEEIINFIRIHLDEVKDDDDVYNDDGDKDELIEVLPPYKNFLIGYLIKFYLLKNNQAALCNYLKLLRIPNYKNYFSELKNIYNRL